MDTYSSRVIFFFLGGGGGGSNFWISIFFWFQTNEYFWGYEDFVDIFEVITKLDYI